MIASVVAMAIAAVRVIERRVRTSRSVRWSARRTMAAIARVSRNGRAFVRLRLMPIV